MQQHRKNTQLKKIAIGAVALGALGIPTALAGPAGAAPAPEATASATSTATARVVTLVNRERAKVGCRALKVNTKLTKAAQNHSKDQAVHHRMSHTGSDGSNPGQRITRAGYRWRAYGENVAYGYSTPTKVMNAWMHSPGHKANILNCSFKEIGVGVSGSNHYWTQDFATRM
ncbi:CAP domain-containing protein [Streptomyces sp. NPDC089919]|uniref:CAP domain-containing protein n=1 Tax=Streptomyces sp. NPDC089919 TaxID=3155188 RepID=UPI003437AC03